MKQRVPGAANADAPKPLTLPSPGGETAFKDLPRFRLVVVTGLVPVIHGSFAAREDVDGRIKSGCAQRKISSV
jgi:hypothetical protein